MPTDVDKAYIKKNKINDLLNELFTALTQNKPDNPLEFSIKHLQSKLPPPPTIVIDQADQADNLISKIFHKTVGAQLTDRSFNSPQDVSQQLSNLNIMGKISRIIVKGKKELTDEEMLENEKIVYYNKKDDSEDEQTPTQVDSFKNDLKNREKMLKHKVELQNLIESIKQQDKKDSGIDSDSTTIPKFIDPKQDAELSEEILTPNSYRFVSLTKKKKIKNASINVRKINENSMQQTLGAKQASIAPNVQLVICSVCSKIQNQKKIDDAKETILEESTVVNNENEETKSKALFFEFFQSQQSQPNTVRNLDDENIESASQVSGPRPITPYEAPTSRSIANESKEKELDIMSWVMARQQQTSQPKQNEQEINLPKPKTPSVLNQSVVSKRLDTSTKSSNQGSELKWKQNYSSGSETSFKK